MTKSSVGPVLILLVVNLLLPSQIQAGGRRRVSVVSPLPAGPRLVFLEPVVDAGAISWKGGPTRSTTTMRTVTLRIGEPSRESRGTATVRAFLYAVDPRCTIRIDGNPLTLVPRVVRKHAPLGIPFTHRLEIEVPVTAADGALQAPIGWEITTD